MFENYLYRPQQAPLARQWSKVRRGLLLTIHFPNGRQLSMFEQNGHHYYVSLIGPQSLF